MKPETEESPELFQEEAKAGRVDARALAIGAFAVGALVGAAVTIGVLIISREAIGRLDIANPPPRKFRIGNLEIEERGDDKRFRVE